MKILHTIASLGAKSGGTSTCTYELVKGLNEHQVKTSILTLDTKDKSDVLLGRESFIHSLENDAFSPYAFSVNFSKGLADFQDYDLYHTNGTWLHINHLSASEARSNNKPYIISPHGMFYPQALQIGAWKKKIFYNLIFKKDLENASCLHATCIQEMNHLRALGLKNPIAVIPNPLSVPDYLKDISRNKTTKKRFGFLGRLHPIKNIHLLLEAWAKLGELTENAELCIIGKGEDAYEEFLKSEVKRLCIHNVTFEGFLTGKEKYEFIGTLTSLILPSKSENFGMTVLEALLMGVPVIASKGTPWEDLEKFKCGWWVENDIETLAQTLQRVLIISDEELTEMGNNGKKLVRDHYVVETVVKKMTSLYKWILGKENKPDFVY